jgi:hypothetical protein
MIPSLFSGSETVRAVDVCDSPMGGFLPDTPLAVTVRARWQIRKRTSLLLVNRAGRCGIIEFSSIHKFDSFVVDFPPPLCARAGALCLLPLFVSPLCFNQLSFKVLYSICIALTQDKHKLMQEMIDLHLILSNARYKWLFHDAL